MDNYIEEEEKIIEDQDLPPEERKKKLREKLFISCKNNDTKLLSRIINDEMLNVEDKDENGWTGLMWAVVNNNIQAVKILLEHHVRNKKVVVDPTSEIIKNSITQNLEEEGNNYDDKFKKPENPTQKGKYNPLHWAAFKGNVIISSLLLYSGFDPLEIDKYGNTALHQAAASNNEDLFILYMGLGLELGITNARNHTPLELTSNKNIKSIITSTLNVKNCIICNKLFDFFNHRFLCSICMRVICRSDCITEYIFIGVNSQDKDIQCCRCVQCYDVIRNNESYLKEAIKSNSLERILEASNVIKEKNIKICVKLHQESETEIKRLETEKKINFYLNSLKVVENHKTISKSVYMLEEMIKESKSKNILIDTSVIDKTSKEKSRLEAERELRSLLSNLTLEHSTESNLKLLYEKIHAAKETIVEKKYIDEAEELSRKIGLNLNAQATLDLLLKYPQREYPVEEIIDPKKKNVKKEPPPKGKKKKEVPFPTPEWAKELKSVIEKYAELKNLIGMSSEIGLDNNFITQSKTLLQRFDKEIKFRKIEDENLRKLEEEKNKKKKKK